MPRLGRFIVSGAILTAGSMAPPAAYAETAAINGSRALGSTPAVAQPSKVLEVGPGRGNGVRRLHPGSAAAEDTRGTMSPAAPVRARAAAPAVTKPIGNERARRAIAGGPLSSDGIGGHADPELRALADAERRLFPRSLLSGQSAFDAQLPMNLGRSGPTLSASGLPLAMSLLPPARPASPAWPRGLSLPNLPVGFEQRTLDYVKFYRDSHRGRSIAEAWARKAGRYSRAIQAELARAGLPTDLVWLSLIESGHNPTIRSPAGAAGLWQFIPESARLYGLTVDRWVDERLDPLRSTQAAVVYLSDLHQRFGTWELAMAAYNMGHHGLTRAIRKYNTNDFWRLARMEAALPWETALYVPKVLAVAIVMRNKRLFGLGNVSPDPAVSFDTIYVPAGVPLASIAEDAGIPQSTLASLNPHYLAARTPPPDEKEPNKRWAVHVPSGQGGAISQRLAAAGIGRTRHATYRVRMGDTPATIAERFGGSERDLSSLNRLRPGERLRAGALVLLPDGWRRAAAAADREPWVVMRPQRFRYPDRERVFYRTLPDDDLESVARAFAVRPEEIVIWNGLDGRARLQADMILCVHIPHGARLPSVRYVRERDTSKQLEVGTPGFFAHFEAEQGRERLQIMAREGDTLVAIGRRHGLSPGTMERINHFSRHERLAEGTPVVVYAKQGITPEELLLSRAPDPLPPVDPPYPGDLPPAPAHSVNPARK